MITTPFEVRGGMSYLLNLYDMNCNTTIYIIRACSWATEASAHIKVRVMLGNRNVPLSTPSPRVSRQIRIYAMCPNSSIDIRVITSPNHIIFHRRVWHLGCARTLSLYMCVSMDKLLKAVLRISDRYAGRKDQTRKPGQSIKHRRT